MDVLVVLRLLYNEAIGELSCHGYVIKVSTADV